MWTVNKHLSSQSSESKLPLPSVGIHHYSASELKYQPHTQARFIFSDSPVFRGNGTLCFLVSLINQNSMKKEKASFYGKQGFTPQFRCLGTLPSGGLSVECLKFLCALIIGIF